MKTRQIHIDFVRVGDVVVIDGETKTVDGHAIKRGGFCGTTLWGDSFRMGTLPVTVVVY